MKERDCLISLSAFNGFGITRIKILFDYYSSYKNIWYSDESELIKIGVNRKLVNQFVSFRNEFNLSEFVTKNRNRGIKIITTIDNNYPANLKEIDGAPICLYFIGNLFKKDCDSVAIVGSRDNSSYGQDVTVRFTKCFADYGATVVSGMARGIDSIAHKTALSRKGRTIAILGSGLDKIYPSENYDLFNKIIQNGAAISEYPLETPPLPGNFIERNRLISGFSKILLVVEGKKNSGTLTTSSFAANQGKTVYAIPGKITDPGSYVPHMLIENGAKIALNPKDILNDLRL